MKRTLLPLITAVFVVCLTACTNSNETSSETHEHSFTETVVSPTFETGGYTTYTCTICGYSYIDNRTEKLSHNYSNNWECNDTMHWRLCSDDGYEYLKTDLSNHIFNEWNVINEPTCLSEGSEYSLCSVCNYRKERTIQGRHNYEDHVCVFCGEEQEYITKLDVSTNGDKTLFAYIYDDTVCQGGHELYFEGTGAISGKFNLLQIDNYNITSIIYGEGVTNAFFKSSKSVNLKRFELSNTIAEIEAYDIILECDLVFPESLKRIISLSGYVEELNLPSTIERLEGDSLAGLHFNKIAINCTDAYFGARVFGAPDNLDYASSNFPGETITINDFVYVVINEGENYVLTHINKNTKDTSFTTITIEEKTMFWEAYSTYGCWYVTDVFIPSSLKYIGMMVFFEMYSLETIHYAGTIDEFSHIIKEDYSQYYNTHSNNGYGGNKIVNVVCKDGSATLTLEDGNFS